MNKRQMLKTMRLMSNKAILQEAGRRGLALIDLTEEPYSNLARKEFVWAIADDVFKASYVEVTE